MIGGDRWGIVTSSELARAGFRAERIAELVAGGEVRRLRRGVFALAEHDVDVARAVAAFGTLSCVSALRKYGVASLEHAETHVRVRHGAAFDRRPGISLHRITHRAVGESHIDDLETSLSLALRCLTPESALVVAESTINSGLLSEDEVRAIADREGSRDVRRIMRWLDGRSMSITETLTRVRLQRLGYHVEPQVKIDGIGYVDLLVRGVHIVECDSTRFHLSREQYVDDHRRDLHAPPLGFTRTRLTYEQVVTTWDLTLECLRAVFSGRADGARRRRAAASRDAR